MLNALEIEKEHLSEYLPKSGFDQESLANLLNLSPITVRRWLHPDRTEKPTSTAFLVLLPLLVAAGVPIINPNSPEAEQAWQDQLRLLKKVSPALAYELMANHTKLTKMKYAASLDASKDLARSKELFLELKKAWDEIEKMKQDM